MLSLHQVVDSLYTQSRPALTWYGPERVELGGPVLARWFSKTANLLTNEYTDLFSPAPGDSQHIVVDLPSCWQKIVWISAATLCGWTVSVPARQELFAHEESPANFPDSNAPSETEGAAVSPATIYVTDRLSPAAQQAQHEGADLLLHNLTLYSLHWDAPLPSGAIDALEALMSHNDILENDHEVMNWPAQALHAHSFEPAFNVPQSVPGDPQQSRIVLHETNALALSVALVELWAIGGSAIVIDPAYHDSDEVASIKRVELPRKDSAEADSAAERRTSIGRLTRPASPSTHTY